MVGGAVRDRLLGLPVKDRDWVVVGATPQQLVDQGFVPVGKDFPVFLHPRTHEQYALARTERKTAPGYRGFTIHATPDVTLEQDLARRDLTINAIAVAAELVDASGNFDPAHAALVDPHHGRRDLQHKLLRHVGDAFREDPVRILRVARFAARFAEFSVAPETLALMRSMVAAGEATALVPERVWQELERGLMEPAPSHMVAALRASTALAVLAPELDANPDVAHLARALDHSARMQAPLPVRFACWCMHLSQPGGSGASDALVRQLCQRLRVPVECRELADLAAREAAQVHGSAALDTKLLVRLLERCDAFRKPARFAQLLWVCECHFQAAAAAQDKPYRQRQHLLAVLEATQAVAIGSVTASAAQAGVPGKEIGALVRAARVAAVAALADGTDAKH